MSLVNDKVQRLGLWSTIKMKSRTNSPASVNKRIEKIVQRKEVPEKLRWKVLVQEALKVADKVPYPYIPRTPGVHTDSPLPGPKNASFSFSPLPEDVNRCHGGGRTLYHCVDYATDIFNYFREAERDSFVREGFMRKQTFITIRMRKILVNWLVEVQMKFKLLNETLFLTVSLIDRFVEHEIIHAVEYQLVGITALLIASKFEEAKPQRISDLISVTDDSYSKNEVLRMEIRMLKSLEFSVGSPLQVHFLRRICQTSRRGAKSYAACKYIAELSLLDAKMVCNPPSILAAASFYVANASLDPDFTWDVSFVRYSGYDEADLAPVVLSLSESLSKLDVKSNPALYKKYSSRKNARISAQPEIESLTWSVES